MNKNPLWTDHELKSAVLCYMAMLEKERHGESYSKTDYRNRLLGGALKNRTPGSFDLRMQNISSVLKDRDQRWIKGYKPKDHVGRTVKDKISKIIDEIYSENTIDFGEYPASLPGQRSGSSGPPPGKGGHWVEGKDNQFEKGYTYVVRFGETDIYKIGYTNNLKRRIGELNKHIPTEELPELSYWTERFSKYLFLVEAYDKEQELLKELNNHRTEGERVKISANKLKKAWDVLMEA